MKAQTLFRKKRIQQRLDLSKIRAEGEDYVYNSLRIVKDRPAR